MTCSACSQKTSCGCSSSCNCKANPNCTAVCTALVVANSWNIPACDAEAILSIPGLATVLIGSYIYNPTYGVFRITAFDSVHGLVTVINDCLPGNAAPGSVVPAGTTFIFAQPPAKVSADAMNLLELHADGFWVPAQDGWIPFNDTATYISANSFSIPGDWTDRVERGDKIKVTQGGPKFFGVISSAFGSGNTTFVVYGGDDYVLVNSPILDPFFSHDDSPDLFPRYFNFTVTVDALAPMTASLDSIEQARVSFAAKHVDFDVAVLVTLGGAPSTTVYINFPSVLAIEGEDSAFVNFPCEIADTGTGDIGLYRSTNAPQLLISKTAAANWVLGSGVVISVRGASPLA